MSPFAREVLAWTFLGLLVASPIVCGIRGWRRANYTLVQWCFWWVAIYFVRVQWRCKPVNLHLPNDGRGAILIFNHRSSVDPFFVQINLKSMMYWMVAKEYVEHPIFGFFLRRCNVIPVNRGGVDNAATRSAIEIARDGGMIGMFPEGRINQTDDLMLSIRPGAILVALKANARVLPVYVDGAPYAGTPWSPLLMRAQVRVRVGELMDLSEYVGRARDAQVVRDLLLQCVDEIARLAGEDGFRPEVAGRKWRDRTDENAREVSPENKAVGQG